MLTFLPKKLRKSYYAQQTELSSSNALVTFQLSNFLFNIEV